MACTIEVKVLKDVNADVEAVVEIRDAKGAKSSEDVRVSVLDAVVVLLVVDDIHRLQNANHEVKAVCDVHVNVGVKVQVKT